MAVGTAYTRKNLTVGSNDTDSAISTVFRAHIPAFMIFPRASANQVIAPASIHIVDSEYLELRSSGHRRKNIPCSGVKTLGVATPPLATTPKKVELLAINAY